MTRTDLLNSLITQYNLRSYLEVGVQNPDNNFNKIIAERKLSVDPDPDADADFPVTSDAFFAMNEVGKFEMGKFGSGELRFDLIFIDGLHHADQVERDIINSMRILNPGGFIVLHDCNPEKEWQQIVPRMHKCWYGDVWRAFVGFQQKYPGVCAWCYDFDCGCGVISHTTCKIEPGFVTDIKWEEFERRRAELLNLKKVLS